MKMRAIAALSAVLTATVSHAFAQIHVDGTLCELGVICSRDVTGSLRPEDGRRAGDNLFFSFSEFNPERNVNIVRTQGVQRIFARVTGDGSTHITEQFRIRDGAADFYLMNPNGVTMGSGLGFRGLLDMRGSFIVTTADAIGFGDAVFSTDSAVYAVADASLGSGVPITFEFAGGKPAPIIVTPDLNDNMIRPDGSLVLIGGDVSVGKNRILESGAGRIDIVSVGSRGTVELNVEDASAPLVLRGFGKLGKVHLDGATVVVDGRQNAGADGASRVLIRASDLIVDGSTIGMRISDNAPGGDVDVRVDGDIVLQQNSDGAASVLNTNSPGNLSVDAGRSVVLRDGGAIRTRNPAGLTGAAAGGQIHLAAGDLIIDGRGSDRLTGVRSETGDIAIDVAGLLSLLAHGEISTVSGSTAKAGDIRVTAGSATLDHAGGAEARITGIASRPESAGDGGSIWVLTRGGLRVLNGARIDTGTLGQGNSGSVNVDAGNIVLDAGGRGGRTGIVSFSSENLMATGNAGEIRVSGRGDVVIRNGALIDSSTFGSGQAGTVDVSAGYLIIDRAGNQFFTGIGSDTDEGSGSAGQVTVDARRIELLRGGLISSGSLGSGDSGSLQVTAGDILIEGSGVASETVLTPSSGIVAASSGTGNAGSVTIEAGKLVVRDGGQISVASANTNAGQLSVRSGNSIHLDRGSISARAAVDGGNVAVSAADRISLSNGSEIVAEAGNDGGNVTLSDAKFAILNDSRISANAVQGTGGNIQVSTAVLLTNSSPITASSQFGADGTVRIDAIFDLSGSLAELDDNLLDAPAQLQPRCSVRIPGETGSFIMVGRGGLPTMPGRYMPSHQLMDLPD